MSRCEESELVSFWERDNSMDTDEHLEESCFIAITEVASVPS